MRGCATCGDPLELATAPNALAGILGVPHVEVDVCRACGGAFLDRDEFGYLTGDMRIDRGGAEPVEGAPAERACPGCGGAMGARAAAGVAFHACAGCGGLWFAGREIERHLG